MAKQHIYNKAFDTNAIFFVFNLLIRGFEVILSIWEDQV